MATQQKPPSSSGVDPRLIVLTTAAVSWIVANVAAWVAFRLAGDTTGGDGSVNPFAAIPQIASKDELVWTPAATVIVALFGLLAVAGLIMGLWKWVKHKSSSQQIDAAAGSMVKSGQIRGAKQKDVQRSAQRLGGGKGKSTGGLMVTRMLDKQRTPLFMSDEQTLLMIAGARMGKTQSLVVGGIVTAPGACVATSSKADVVDLTLWPRAQVGQTWIFDPQNVYSDSDPCWWWNPLALVKRPADARRLASYFADGVREPDAKKDAYFDAESERAFAACLLAAALAGGDLTHVFEWLMTPTNPLPVKILRAQGFAETARSAEQMANLTERQRDGIFGMARRYVDLLEDPSIARAVLPPEQVRLGISADDKILRKVAGHRHSLAEFSIADFVDSECDTLYLLTRAGADSATGLTAAMVGEVFFASIRKAQRSPGRRLPTPLRAVLDEVANTVPLRNLPQWYSDFGSQGITPLAFLQSREQGEGVWGANGMRALSGTANIHIYGGNSDDTKYLGELSELVGEAYTKRVSVSSNRDGRSRTQSYEKERILTVNDLGAMPTERQLTLIAGNKPVLGEKVFWSELPEAGLVQQSLDFAKNGALDKEVHKLQQSRRVNSNG